MFMHQGICLTFPLHVLDQLRGKPVAQQLLVQVERSLSFDFIIRNPIVLVAAPRPRALGMKEEQRSGKLITGMANEPALGKHNHSWISAHQHHGS